MNWIILWIIYTAICFHFADAVLLNGKWKGYILSKENDFFTAEVPGGIFTDLEKTGRLPRNLVGFNDVNNRWIANESIVYTTDIPVNDLLFNTSHIILTFNGLDTFSTIYVNNIEVGRTSNMFLKYNFDIKNELKSGKNELKVIFESSVKVAKKLYTDQSVKYIVPPKCTPKEYNGECHVNHIRKMQASYGWDWGAAFPSMGIWRDVEILPVENVMVSEITTDVVKKNDSWQLIIVVFFETFRKSDGVLSAKTHISSALNETNSINNITTNLQIKYNRANATILLDIPAKKVKEWWPNGYGKQKLYNLNVKVKTGRDAFEKNIKIGFRTVELVQDPIQNGLSFYFKINGIPIFAKGSNWIPSSVFPENLSNKETLQYLLKSSKDTHMNMLRVWGGGVYESDLFYDLADEYGIMIWQDFMFACSMYPTTKSFLDNVKKEVIQNTKRLKHHPSIVLWAGNNENEAALYGNWYGTGKAQVYKDDYVKLYVDTIKDTAVKIDATKPFLISSPSNGLYSEEKNYTESNPYSNLYGDVHYYNYLKNGWDINQYPITRFASEYGFQALPSIWTLISASENSTDLQLNSSFMKHRQHLPGGNAFMSLLISKNFVVPKNNNSITELVDYIYLSQVTQAVSMRIQTESYRQMKSSFNDLGEGMTMGALYWQLNDVWQAPSWSSIDFEGRWKMLHYYVKEFFAPIIVTSRVTKSNELLIYVVSDLLNALENLTVEIIVFEWKSGKPIYSKELNNLLVKPNESKLVAQYWLDKFLEQAGCGPISEAKENCFIELNLKNSCEKLIAPLNYVYPSSFKNISLPNDSITVKIKSDVDHETSNPSDFEIEVSSKKIALFVWLELGNVTGQFSENGFHILRNKKNIFFKSSQPISVKDIEKNIIVTSLSRIYDYNLRNSDVKIVIDKALSLDRIDNNVNLYDGKYTS